MTVHGSHACVLWIRPLGHKGDVFIVEHQQDVIAPVAQLDMVGWCTHVHRLGPPSLLLATVDMC